MWVVMPTNEIQLFCLHCFSSKDCLPIRKRLMESWNNHRLCTEHGLTPEQLWTRGLCLADQSTLVQPSVSENYVVENGQLNPAPFDMGSVVHIPEIDLNLSDIQLEELQAIFSLLCASEYQDLQGAGKSLGTPLQIIFQAIS